MTLHTFLYQLENAVEGSAINRHEQTHANERLTVVHSNVAPAVMSFQQC